MLDGVEDRVKKRLTGETYDETIMSEIIQTVTDRLCLRLGVNESTFPSCLNPLWLMHPSNFGGGVTMKESLQRTSAVCLTALWKTS